MKDFKQRGSFGGKRGGGFGDRGGNRSSFGEKRGNSDFPRRDSRDARGGGFGPAKFKATCADCGDSCEVPFRPSGERPVYCSNCFKNKENGRPGQFSDRSVKPSFERTASKPFVSQPVQTGGISLEQFNKLDRKLDQIIEFLNSIVIEEDEELDAFDDESEIVSESSAKPFVAEVVEKKILVPATPKKETKAKEAVKKKPASATKSKPVSKKGKKK